MNTYGTPETTCSSGDHAREQPGWGGYPGWWGSGYRVLGGGYRYRVLGLAVSLYWVLGLAVSLYWVYTGPILAILALYWVYTGPILAILVPISGFRVPISGFRVPN